MYSLLNGLTSLKLHPQSIFIHFYFLAFLETTLFYAFFVVAVVVVLFLFILSV